MTTTIGGPAPATPVSAPIPVPRMAPQRRWRPGLVALAVALIATGGLTAAYAVTLVGGTHAYLAVGREVQAGTRITEDDLVVVRISADPGLRPLAADRVADVVGKYAAVPLFPGELLTERQLTDVPLGGAGTYLVSIAVPQDRVPAQRIRPGVKVLLVATPSDSFGSSTEEDEETEIFQATVVDITPGTQPGRYYVNVSVADGDGARIATLAAANRIVIMLAGG
ncbi:MAG: flagellar biosynthesis protein FlgA [Micromonosporaceae bacterium]|nr:flagellar biosynthesis protein FlgA [Micromonosporaceae bacterium]